MAHLESTVRTLYTAARRIAPPDAPIASLAIGPERTLVALGTTGEPAAVLNLAAGARRIAREQFHGVLPGAGDIENAIAQVEDEIARVGRRVPSGTRLYGGRAGLAPVALAASAESSGNYVLARSAVEQVFNRMTAVASGQRPAGDDLPATADFAATVVILREFMHHFQFDAVTVAD